MTLYDGGTSAVRRPSGGHDATDCDDGLHCGHFPECCHLHSTLLLSQHSALTAARRQVTQ